MGGRAVIHINGKDYDAHDGSLIHGPGSAAARNIDGIISDHRVARQHKPTHASRTVKKATTLMRGAVKKPKIFSDIKHTPIVMPARSVKPALPEHHVPRVKKSSIISHFSPIEPQAVIMSPTPEPHPETFGVAKREPAPSRQEAYIKKQLEHATAHMAEKPKKNAKGKTHAKNSRKKKGASLAAGMAALLLVGGFIVYQSIPQLSFAVASRRAGFGASLPHYTPSGFSIDGPVAYGPGRVVISFSSHTDDRDYKIEQTPSSLTTDTLKDQISTDSGNQYQTYNQGGLTIFISPESASWVDRGVLFTLKGDSGLSNTQIASIASSM